VAVPRSPAHVAFGEALREIRMERGFSQERLAQVANLDRTYVSGIERGERNPSFTNILRLAAALDVRVSDLALRAEARQEPTAEDSGPI
jgi:transcriptional regulator with XRE-family HTH domain